ncbi:GNAT family N-acetyltransferase [Thalassotalea sp. M1531]|uniref:GNAT family N-acetyltransferase n=1 Tax=Thalassotalea algicola TaxID=2716224 RepID=A0A7Y0Q5S9_9GAMM|nr:GNAT family N-acetyltransferase [Thalassotalea algicola]NMP30047.1 GNAT family N-acetyltransferase [Thalassotalea algicola]
MISYQPAKNLSKSAEITYNNMRSYYEHYDVDWPQSKILEQIIDLDNWDILFDGQVIGALRLSFDRDTCHLRDLQVNKRFQNKGIGAMALAESTRLALNSGANKLSLKVFKISPAHHLYQRTGFKITSEDGRFYYMEQVIT